MNGKEWTFRVPGEPDRSLGVSEIPGRKSVALWMRNGSAVYPLAYFRNEEYAEAARDLIDSIARCRSVIEEG